MKGFLSDLYRRPSCYECRCKNGVSHSDLTIADFWGIDRLMPDFDDDKGVGLVLISTEKGFQTFNVLRMDVRESTLEAAKKTNGGFKERVILPPERVCFFRDFNEGTPVSETVERLLKVSLYKRLRRFLKRGLKIFLR